MIITERYQTGGYSTASDGTERNGIIFNHQSRISSSTECVWMHDGVCVYNAQTTGNEEVSTMSTRKPKVVLRVRFSNTNDVLEFEPPTREEQRGVYTSPDDDERNFRELVGLLHARLRGCGDDWERKNGIIEELCLHEVLERQRPERKRRVRSAIRAVLRRQSASQTMIEAHHEAYWEISRLSARLAASRGFHAQERVPSPSPRAIVMAR